MTTSGQAAPWSSLDSDVATVVAVPVRERNRYRRVMLKLSGQVFGGGEVGFGIEPVEGVPLGSGDLDCHGERAGEETVERAFKGGGFVAVGEIAEGAEGGEQQRGGRMGQP